MISIFILYLTSTSNLDSLTATNSIMSYDILSSKWFWISILEFVIIIILLVRLKKTKKPYPLAELSKTDFKKSKLENIDMEELMSSINKSKALYKSLSSKCHPDKFINSPLHKNSEDIFKEITLNKSSYSKLLELKQKAINELNIKF